jgi:hypothetical protein
MRSAQVPVQSNEPSFRVFAFVIAFLSSAGGSLTGLLPMVNYMCALD